MSRVSVSSAAQLAKDVKAGVATREDLRAARKLERKARKEVKAKAPTMKVMAKAMLPTTGTLKAYRKELKAVKALTATMKKPSKGLIASSKSGYPGVADGSKLMSKDKNRMVRVASSTDGCEFTYNGNWQGVSITTDSATPPTAIFNGTLQSIRINPYTLGDTIAKEAANWEEYVVKAFELRALPLNGITNTPGLMHFGVVQDPAYLTASGQSISKDYIDSLAEKSVTPVYNQNAPAVLRYKHDVKRCGREWFKVYASSQTISSAPVVAEVRETYQLSIVGFPQGCTPSTELAQFEMRVHIAFRGWKTPVTLVRESVDEMARALMAHHSNESARVHEEVQTRRRLGEKVETPPRIFHPSHLSSILAEIQRLLVNRDYLTDNEKKLCNELVRSYNSMITFRRALERGAAASFKSLITIPRTGDVPVSAVPVVIVDPTLSTDPRIAGLAKAAKVDGSGVLQTVGGGPGTVQDVRILGDDGKTPLITDNSAVFQPNYSTAPKNGAIMVSSAALAAPLIAAGNTYVPTTFLTALDGSGSYQYNAPSQLASDGTTTAVGKLPVANADGSVKVGGALGAFGQETTGFLRTTVNNRVSGDRMKINPDGSVAMGGSNNSVIAQSTSGQALTSIVDAANSVKAKVNSDGSVNIGGSNDKALLQGTAGNLLPSVVDYNTGVPWSMTANGYAKTVLVDNSNGYFSRVEQNGAVRHALYDKGNSSTSLWMNSDGTLDAQVVNITTNRVAQLNADGSLVTGGSSAAWPQVGAQKALGTTLMNPTTGDCAGVNTYGHLDTEVNTGANKMSVNTDGSIPIAGNQQVTFSQTASAHGLYTYGLTAPASSDSKGEAVSSKGTESASMVPIEEAPRTRAKSVERPKEKGYVVVPNVGTTVARERRPSVTMSSDSKLDPTKESADVKKK